MAKFAKVALHPEAMACLKADFLRPQRPSFTACYYRLKRIADERGWVIPSLATSRRRLDDEIAALGGNKAVALLRGERRRG